MPEPYTGRQSTHVQFPQLTHVRDGGKVQFIMPEQPTRKETQSPGSEDISELSTIQNDHDVSVPTHELAAESRVNTETDTAIILDRGENPIEDHTNLAPTSAGLEYRTVLLSLIKAQEESLQATRQLLSLHDA
jgi:hypothetical protein